MDLASLTRHQRTAGRVAEIVKVLARYSLADWLRKVNVEGVRHFLTGVDGRPIAGVSFEARVRMALTELGPTFIKLGQILSTRPDLIGPALAHELSSLQANTPAEPTDSVCATIKAELGRPVEELFAQFDARAFASASIGQVHRARLHGGAEVVVKVQHKDIEEKVQRDLDILKALADLGEKHSAELRRYRPRATVNEFRRTITREMDFRRELRNLEEFIGDFRSDPTVRFPKPYPELSSRRVLTMEFLDGISIGETERLKETGHDLGAIARCGADVCLAMIFRDGFYHADPHPGNLLVLPGKVLGLIDCGMVGRLEDQTRDAFTTALMAAINRDVDGIMDVVIRLATVPADLDREAFRAELNEFLSDYGTQPLNQFDVSGALNGITEIIRRFHIILPPAFALLLRFLVVLEGTARQLDPSFSLAEMIQPYYLQILREKFSPRRILRRVQRAVVAWDRLFMMLPGDLADIMERLRRGEMKVHLEHRRLESSVRLLVQGILTAAIFLGSSQMLSSRVPPTLFDVSLTGAMGMSVSVALFLRLFWVSRRRRDEP
jgi:ubiquinone biosynthesis protein